MDQKNLTPDSALKAVVLEVFNDSAVVLTDEGQFLSVRTKKGMSVGQSIYCFEDDLVEVGQRRSDKPPLHSIGKLASMAVAAAILLFTFVGLIGRLESPVALITIDINPSLELAVAHNGKVTALSALNDDGERIKSQIDFKGKDYMAVVQAILKEAQNEGYDLKSKATIVGVGALNEGSVAYAESISNKLNQLKVENHWLVYMTPELVKQEKGHHESIGKKLHNKDINNQRLEELEEKDDLEDEGEIEHGSKTKIEDSSNEKDAEEEHDNDNDEDSDDVGEDEED